MKHFFIAGFISLVSLAFAQPASAELICAPRTLVHITTVDVTPGIDPASFNAQPREFYRIGSSRARIEEVDDPANAIHEIVTINEPNIWLANLDNKTGKHLVDPGPSLNAKMPVFGVQGSPAKLLSFELGCEGDFIAANAPKPTRVEHIGADSFNVYRVEAGADAVELLEIPNSGKPSYARYYRSGKLLIALKYTAYLSGLPDDPTLFAPIANVNYVDQ